MIDAADKGPGTIVWQHNGVAADQAIRTFIVMWPELSQPGHLSRGDVRELSLGETEAIADRLKPSLKDS